MGNLRKRQKEKTGEAIERTAKAEEEEGQLQHRWWMDGSKKWLFPFFSPPRELLAAEAHFGTVKFPNTSSSSSAAAAAVKVAGKGEKKSLG